MQSDKPVTGRHVLMMMLGFFGVIFAVNGVFAFLAIDTFTGLETEQAYLKGLDYNRTLTAAAEQRARGWQVNLTEDTSPEGRRRFVLHYAGKEGRPLYGLEVTLELRRPSHADFDQRVTLTEVGDGRYAAELDLPALGQWKARVEARRDGEVLHQLDQRLWLK